MTVWALVRGRMLLCCQEQAGAALGSLSSLLMFFIFFFVYILGALGRQASPLHLQDLLW